MFGWLTVKMAMIAGAVVLIMAAVWYIYERGGDAEKAKIVEKIQENVKVSSKIQNRNRRSSSSDIAIRLSRWQRD